ncbi:bolA-like protein [Colletotrichum tofieldiae]|uniref:BolA-like protein n=1 Tax=Colletotrichum tofieldiae TaxID=708197 RepID=A0A166Q6J6_9PEZI|nr:BolA-like protein [Colletotrichum tofieldiae]GKT52791.1 BolA-like protein [Colletotrichum tofieldiae]GKT80808.1 bolA-like protein [Colletotrichum tofieldiae]GKT88939.1 bolA domain-containing protein [Colletotrichum tofieldiae]
MLCRSCRRVIAVSKPSPNNIIARASVTGLPIATRNHSSQSVLAARSSPSSAFASRPPPQSIQTSSKRLYSSETSTSPALEKPDHLDTAESTIWDKLVAEFAPSELIVQDVSGGCGSMYAIDITSAKFKGANMLKQQRMVNAVLGDMMKQWHGVQLRTKAP